MPLDHIDNTPLLTGVLEILTLGEDLVAMLNARSQTPTQRETYKAVKTVVEGQARVIRNLALHQTELMDKLNDLIDQLNLLSE